MRSVKEQPGLCCVQCLQMRWPCMNSNRSYVNVMRYNDTLAKETALMPYPSIGTRAWQPLQHPDTPAQAMAQDAFKSTPTCCVLRFVTTMHAFVHFSCLHMYLCHAYRYVCLHAEQILPPQKMQVGKLLHTYHFDVCGVHLNAQLLCEPPCHAPEAVLVAAVGKVRP